MPPAVAIPRLCVPRPLRRPTARSGGGGSPGGFAVPERLRRHRHLRGGRLLMGQGGRLGGLLLRVDRLLLRPLQPREGRLSDRLVHSSFLNQYPRAVLKTRRD